MFDHLHHKPMNIGNAKQKVTQSHLEGLIIMTSASGSISMPLLPLRELGKNAPEQQKKI